MYALVTNTPMSFPRLFIRSLIEIHRSSSTAHALFFPVFIYWNLLHLGLDEFLAFEPIHVIAPIGATFFRQRTAQMWASSKHPRVDSSFSGAPPPPPPPSTSGDSATTAYVDPTAIAAVLLPSTSDDLDIHRMLETVMTVQAVHGQLLVDMRDELQSLRADLESLHQSPLPPHSPPFDDEWLPFGNSSQKGEVYMGRRFLLIRGDFVFWSCGALDCI